MKKCMKPRFIKYEKRSCPKAASFFHDNRILAERVFYSLERSAGSLTDHLKAHFQFFLHVDAGFDHLDQHIGTLHTGGFVK